MLILTEAVFSDTPGYAARPEVRCKMTPPDGRNMPLDLRLKVGVLIAPTRDRNSEVS